MENQARAAAPAMIGIAARLLSSPTPEGVIMTGNAIDTAASAMSSRPLRTTSPARASAQQ